uniref:Major intrinsically disordered Notch2-binding receptor 1-like C-terminal domain-containing protein n=1 Tax=Periophthalmus magnuspinnatus TaxID=409849 RepID=A0A3B3ZQD3_9GOBI
MDISALPNNNDPERFLQLDVGMLPATHGMFQLQAVMSSQRHWHNRVYNQVTMEGQRVRGEGQSRVPSPENSPVTTIKTNPLYMDFTEMEQVDNEKNKPSWTVQEYDTQTVHGNLADYLKKTPKDLDFWLEELYTPGFDSLLRKKEAEEQQKKICKFLSLTLLSICVILIVILVPVMVLKKSN